MDNITFIGSYQPTFLPSYDFFKWLNFCDVFDFSGGYDLVDSTHLRARIGNYNQIKYLRSPVSKGSYEGKNFFNTHIDQKLIDNFFDQIDRYYAPEAKRYPHFKELLPLITDTIIYSAYRDPRSNLFDFHFRLIKSLCSILRIDTKLTYAEDSDYLVIKGNPSRTVSNQLKRVAFTNKITDNLTYISEEAGRNYLNKVDFDEVDIKIEYIDESFCYDYHLDNNLSIIHHLFKYGIEQTIRNLDIYRLVGDQEFCSDFINDR